RVGATILTVAVEAPADCAECGRAIPEGERETASWSAGTCLCARCRRHTGATATPPPRAAPSLEGRTGDVVGDYELGPLLGKGGMGAVYRARRRSDGGDVAVKLLLPRLGA